VSRLQRPLLGLAAALVLGLHGVAGWGLSRAGGAAQRSTPQPPVVGVSLLIAADSDVGWQRARPGAPAAQALAPAGASDDPSPIQFLLSADVDLPARPVGTWTLDAESLSLLGLHSVVFDIWVDAQARALALRVVRIEPVALLNLKPLIEARLLQTPMVAAQLGGRAVAHQQRIELGWVRPPGGSV
jgi:hypothetical protein